MLISQDRFYVFFVFLRCLINQAEERDKSRMPRARERLLPNESHLLLLQGKTEAKKRCLEGEYKPDSKRTARSDRSTIHGKFKVVHASDGSREYVPLTRELGSLVPRCGHEIPRGQELARSHSGSHSASHGDELEGLHGLATVARDTIWSPRYPWPPYAQTRLPQSLGKIRPERS